MRCHNPISLIYMTSKSQFNSNSATKIIGKNVIGKLQGVKDDYSTTKSAPINFRPSFNQELRTENVTVFCYNAVQQ